MALDTVAVRECLAAGDLRLLFREHLGWDNATRSHPIELRVDGNTYFLTEAATKAGVAAFECTSDFTGRIPPHAVRASIEREATRAAFEHVLVYVNDRRTEQLWRPSQSARHGPTTCSFRCFPLELGQGMLDALRKLQFRIGAQPSLIDVASRVRAAFTNDRFAYYLENRGLLQAAERAAAAEVPKRRPSVWNYHDDISYPSGVEQAEGAFDLTLRDNPQLRQYLTIERQPLPLDTVFSPFNSRRPPLTAAGWVYADLRLHDPNDAPELQAEHEELRAAVEFVLNTLTSRERRVLQLRFGLEDGRSRTLEEVGREFGVTRERIRQIEAKALKKLRHPSRARNLVDWDQPTPFPKPTDIRAQSGWRVLGSGAIFHAQPVRFVSTADEGRDRWERVDNLDSAMPFRPFHQAMRDARARHGETGVSSELPGSAATPCSPPPAVPAIWFKNNRLVVETPGANNDDDFIIGESTKDEMERLRDQTERAETWAAIRTGLDAGTQSEPGAGPLDNNDFLIGSPATPVHQPPLELPGSLPLFEQPPAPATAPPEVEAAPIAAEQQPKLFEIPPIPELDGDDALLGTLQVLCDNACTVEDFRDRGGALWVFGAREELDPLIVELRMGGHKFNYAFHKRSNAWGWWTK